jgi:serine protease Do
VFSKPNRLGLVLSELPPAQRRALGIDHGLLVEKVEGKGAAVPLRPGDVILAVGGEPLKTVEEFERLISSGKSGDTVALLVRRGEATVFVPVEVGSG